jgi:hypothetical protein
MLHVETVFDTNEIKVRIGHVDKEGDKPQFFTFDDDAGLRDDLGGSLCAVVLSDFAEVLERHAAREGTVITPLFKLLTADAKATAVAYQVALDQQIAKAAAKLAEAQAASKAA